MKVRKRIFILLSILWMGVIFVYSAQPGDESTETSIWAGMTFGRIFVPHFEEWSCEQQIEFAEKIDHPVRKAAHFTEFAILGFFVTGAYADNNLHSKSPKKHRRFLVPWIIGSIYASMDEFHQRFVPERNGNLKDVLLDSSGVAFGVLMMLFILYIASGRKESVYEEDSTDKKST